MKDFWRILKRYVRPYRGYLGGSVVMNILSAVFNVFSFSLLIPILQILFNVNEMQYVLNVLDEVMYEIGVISWRDKIRHLIYDNLMRNNDEFFVLKDFNAYVDAWKELEALYSDKTAWGKISVTNTACSGFFSSDRTIEEYVSDIWHLDK